MDLKNWSVMRFLRLAVGAWALTNGMMQKDFLLLGLSAFVLFQAITNTGCCAAGNCSTSVNKKADTKDALKEPVEFEEV
jgi:hypothetical protein